MSAAHFLDAGLTAAVLLAMLMGAELHWIVGAILVSNIISHVLRGLTQMVLGRFP